MRPKKRAYNIIKKVAEITQPLSLFDFYYDFIVW